MSELGLPERMREIALDLPEPDDMTNREYWLRTEILEWADKFEAMERQFPMQKGPSIPWSLAEKIYVAYQRVCGNQQSLERLAERGGFGWAEVERMGKLYRERTGRPPWPEDGD